MKTIMEIMKVTECSLEQAEKLYTDLHKLPEKLREFMSYNLDIVNAYNADEITVRRHSYYSRDSGDIMVKRVSKRFPTYSDGTPNYDYWKYCFNWSNDYVGVKVYIKGLGSE